MSLDADALLDRQRLKRQLNIWRVLAILALLGCALIAAGRFVDLRQPHVARVVIDGLITEDRRLATAIAGLATDDSVRALIVAVDSPGGTVAGGESLHGAIAAVAAKKPVVTVMGGTAASAGYMIAVPAVRIFAHESTLTGSIGVILQTGELSGLLGKLGISAEAITSGPLKDQPSFTRPLSDQGREVLHALVMDMYDQFVGRVAAGRHMSPDDVRKLADGRAYTGRQARALGLVDEIGGEAEARAWLARERDVSASLPIETVSTAGLAARLLGSGDSVLSPLWNLVIDQRLTLDGPLALWQPGSMDGTR